MVRGNRSSPIRPIRPIKIHVTSAAEAHGVGFCAREVIEPEVHVEFARLRIVLDERELSPAHGPVDPGRCGQRDWIRSGGRRRLHGPQHSITERVNCASDYSGFQKFATRREGHEQAGLKL